MSKLASPNMEEEEDRQETVSESVVNSTTMDETEDILDASMEKEGKEGKEKEKEKEEEEEEETLTSVSPQAMATLVHLMMNRGYFNKGGAPIHSTSFLESTFGQEEQDDFNALDDDDDDDSIEAMQAWKKREQQKLVKTGGGGSSSIKHNNSFHQQQGCIIGDCEVVCSLDGSFVTLSQLKHDLKELVIKLGRLTVQEASTRLLVDVDCIQTLAESLSQDDNDDDNDNGGDDNNSHFKMIHLTHRTASTAAGGTSNTMELISTLHLNHLVSLVATQLKQQNGRVVLSNLVDSTNADAPFRWLSTEFCKQVIDERIGNSKLCIGHSMTQWRRNTTVKGEVELVLDSYVEMERKQLLEFLSGLTEPTTYETIVKELNMDLSLTSQLMFELHKDITEIGEIKGHNYVPKCFEVQQRKHIEELFASNGFLTFEKGATMGIAPEKMTTSIKQSFPSAIFLDGVVMNPDVLVEPITEAVTGTNSNNDSFVDLKPILPQELAMEDNDNDVKMQRVVRQIIKYVIIDSLGCSGTVVVDSGEILYFSAGMTSDISTRVLPPLIESFSKRRAEEMEQHGKLDSIGTAEDKRKGKKSFTRNGEAVDDDECMIPVELVAKGLTEAYPELAEIQKRFQPNRSASSSSSSSSFSSSLMPVPWDDEGGTATTTDDMGGPLCNLCRQVLNIKELREQCARAVRAELHLLVLKKQGGSIASRKEGAAKVELMEHSFEEVFPDACYLLQMHAKFVRYASKAIAASKLSDSNSTGSDDAEQFVISLEREFLTGCCANFACRITEYCIFQRNSSIGDEGIFRFGAALTNDDKILDNVGKDGDHAYSPMYAYAVDLSQRTFPVVSIKCSPSEDGKPREPLRTLRDLFPGNVGISLSQMWSLCTEDNSNPGKYEDFLKLAEEACLSLCRFPFKQLDKKSEKLVLSSRKQMLLDSLDRASEAGDVLEMTVMLLYQQVKSVAAFGGNLNGAVLELLARERKIPSNVSDILLHVAHKLIDGKGVTEAHLSQLREFANCKDISKYKA